MALYPHADKFHHKINWGKDPDPPPDNGEPLWKLRRQCASLFRRRGISLPSRLTREFCLVALKSEREYQASRRIKKGARARPGATVAECLVALAKRLNINTEDCDPQSQGLGLNVISPGPWRDLWRGDQRKTHICAAGVLESARCNWSRSPARVREQTIESEGEQRRAAPASPSPEKT